MFVGVSVPLIVYSSQLKLCLLSVFIGDRQGGCVLYPKLCWEGSVLLPGWIITIRQSCASRWESPTGSTSEQTHMHLTIILLIT